MLTINGLALAYGAFEALRGISLEIRAGEIVALLGANGAGKTSTFRALSGLQKGVVGSVRFDGTELVGRRPAAIVADGLVQCPEGRRLFPAMSVQRNLQLGAYVHRADRVGNRQRLDDVFALFPVLHQKRADAAGSLSGGQQQMVAIGRALMGRPKMLLLDEPSLGLAPLVVRTMFEIIQSINAQGTAVLIAEQNAHAALKVAHRGYVLERGRVVLEGTRDSLLGNEAIRRAYIGA